ncbi:MAG: class I tRNA ligase family protein, partial [Candidatus Thermoplasmatota archaeon]|nr:class I tRNA ligase family protein [Candidatus Thermoplasmatota archaeon]
RLYEGDLNAAWVLHRIVKDLLTIFSPICPFFTDYLSTTLYGHSAVDVRSFPPIPVSEFGDTERGDLLRKMTHSLVSFNGDVWKTKKDSGTSLNSPISNIKIPIELELLEDALTKMHKLE